MGGKEIKWGDKSNQNILYICMNCQTTKLINKKRKEINSFFNPALQCLSFIDFNSHLSFGRAT